MLLTSWYTIFYLFSVLDRLGGLFFGLMALFAILTLIGLMNWSGMSYNSEGQQTGKKWAQVCAPLAFLFLLLAVAIPDKKDMLLIVAGGSVGEFISHNEDAKAIPSEVTKWLRAEIKDATAELNPALQAKKAEYQNLDKEELVKRLLAAKDSIK